METSIIQLLDNQNLSLGKVAAISGVSKSTLASATKRPIETWTIKTLNAFAEALGEKSGNLLNMLQQPKYKFHFNDKKQTLQGVFIADLETYKIIKFSVQNNIMEGWHPTKEDIEHLRDKAYNPDSEDLKKFQELFGDKK